MSLEQSIIPTISGDQRRWTHTTRKVIPLHRPGRSSYTKSGLEQTLYKHCPTRHFEGITPGGHVYTTPQGNIVGNLLYYAMLADPMWQLVFIHPPFSCHLGSYVTQVHVDTFEVCIYDVALSTSNLHVSTLFTKGCTNQSSAIEFFFYPPVSGLIHYNLNSVRSKFFLIHIIVTNITFSFTCTFNFSTLTFRITTITNLYYTQFDPLFAQVSATGAPYFDLFSESELRPSEPQL